MLVSSTSMNAASATTIAMSQGLAFGLHTLPMLSAIRCRDERPAVSLCSFSVAAEHGDDPRRLMHACTLMSEGISQNGINLVFTARQIREHELYGLWRLI